MELTQRHLYLLARLGYTQYHVAQLSEQEQEKLLAALDGREVSETYTEEEEDDDIWGLGAFTA